MGYAVKLQKGGMVVYNDDLLPVELSGDDTGTFTFKVCYVSKTEIDLMCTASIGTAAFSVANAKTWSWEVIINGRTYRSSDANQSKARIPTVAEIMNKTAGYILSSLENASSTGYLLADSNYWTSYCCFVQNKSGYSSSYFQGEVYWTSGKGNIVPRINIKLV